MTDDDRLIEVQGTGEQILLCDQMNQLLDLGAGGIRQLFEVQRVAIEAAAAE
jgi:ribonuclease PH